MKKPAKKAPVKKPSMKEVVRENRLLRKFTLTMQVEGDMLDKDTPISEESLAAYFQLKYNCPKGMKLSRIEAKEIKDLPSTEAPPSLEAAPVAAEPTPIPPQVPGI